MTWSDEWCEDCDRWHKQGHSTTSGFPAKWHETTGHEPIGTASGMRCEKDNETWPCETRVAAEVAYDLGAREHMRGEFLHLVHRVFREIEAQQDKCASHWPMPKGDCTACQRHGAFTRAARIVRAASAEGGPWTRHGHAVPGVTVVGAGRPPAVSRCGGPAVCAECAMDAERLRRPHLPSTFVQSEGESE